MIDSHPDEIVNHFKYHGTLIDSKMSFQDNTYYDIKKCMHCLFLIRKLRSSDVSQNILEIVYMSLVESMLTYNITSWYGYLNCKQKNTLTRVINIASKVIGKPQRTLNQVGFKMS